MTGQPDETGGGAERRRFPRTGVVWSGTFEVDGRAFECLALNLSANGAYIHMFEMPEHGGDGLSGSLVLPRLGALEADVVWRRHNAMGLQFREDPAVVARLLKEALPGSRAATTAAAGYSRPEADPGV
jgi:hypothetical protein